MSDKLVNDVCGVTVSVNGAVEVLVSVTEVSLDVEPVIAVKILSTPPSQSQSSPLSTLKLIKLLILSNVLSLNIAVELS